MLVGRVGYLRGWVVGFGGSEYMASSFWDEPSVRGSLIGLFLGGIWWGIF
jgi:hypothetical protein